jgi:hypothetical protein
MELDARDMLTLHHGGELVTMTDRRSTVGGDGCRERVCEVDVRAIRDAVEDRTAPDDVQHVPPDVRDLQRTGGGNP